MTRKSKDYLETLLSPYGNVEVAKQVPGEIREIDLYFIPNSPPTPLHPYTLILPPDF
jgi:hypothetical protein